MPEWARSWVTVTASEFRKILPKMICFVAMLVCLFYCNMCLMTSIVIFRLNISLSPMPESTTSSQVLPIIQLTSHISKTLVNGLYMVDLQMKSGMTSVSFMRIFAGMLYAPLLFLHSFCVPEQSHVFINEFYILHQS